MNNRLWKEAKKDSIVMFKVGVSMFVVGICILCLQLLGVVGNESTSVLFFTLGFCLPITSLPLVLITRIPLSILLARNVSPNNPDVLRVVLAYLKGKTIKPRDEFVDTLNQDIAVLKNDLGTYKKDEGVLSQALENSDDESMALINRSALLRVRQIIPSINERLETLVAQKKRAIQIVAPVVTQIDELQSHLDRLTRDERLANSVKMVGRIDLRILINEEFLGNLAVATDKANYELNELTIETEETNVAWAEARLASTLEAEDEIRLEG